MSHFNFAAYNKSTIIMKFQVCIHVVILAFFSLPSLVSAECSKTILYLPLDERYTTRNAFLNLAASTPFCILTPSPAILPSLKSPADLTSIHLWIDKNAEVADAMILSAEMFLYGGLIASRISNDTLADVESRLQKLFSYSQKYPSLEIFISSVVMRIPSYDGDFEEPWYWANYGDELFTYSFHLDKYNQLKVSEDLLIAQRAVKDVPPSAVDEFQWRRSRNHQITMEALRAVNEMSPPPFRYFYTTLDDSAEFGFNIRESQEIRDYIESNETHLSYSQCPVYPGADEVHLTMLAKISVMFFNNNEPVSLNAVFRSTSTIGAIPAYEGQPMIDTLLQQVAAAGGDLLWTSDNSRALHSAESGHPILLVNNFDGAYQQEASEQSLDEADIDFTAYKMFDDAITTALESEVPVGFCDNYFANGGDNGFVAYMAARTADDGLRHVAYAGWNTNGNTIGTVVANTIILKLFAQGQRNAEFTALRLTEDMYYQGVVRKELVAFVNEAVATAADNSEESTSFLTPDLEFYQRYVFKLLASKYRAIAATYGQQCLQLDSVYFPWNRTFEIGLQSSASASDCDSKPQARARARGER